MNNQGNRDRQKSTGPTGRDSANPAGTSPRHGHDGRPQGDNTANRPPAPRPNRVDDDEESGLGNRTTFR